MALLEVRAESKKYSIHVEKGLLDRLGAFLAERFKPGLTIVVTDSNVEELYGEKIRTSLEDSGWRVSFITVSPGEKSKSPATLLKLYEEMIEAGLTRSDLLIAFGGGVVGDLTGFAASTIYRGVPYVQVPTTLLAQIDSSIGGKTAIDLPQGKNLVGSFYHPEAVYIDPELLKTLQPKFFRDGLSEAIKSACIRNAELFDLIAQVEGQDDFHIVSEEIIIACLKVKRDIVEQDEKDTGERMLLNFGHTLGHAVEKYFGFESFSHGEAVAIGMYNITLKSEQWGLTTQGTAEKIKNILVKFQLPYELPAMDKESVIKAISVDKKNMNNKLRLCFIKTIGEGFIWDLDKERIAKLL